MVPFMVVLGAHLVVPYALQDSVYCNGVGAMFMLHDLGFTSTLYDLCFMFHVIFCVMCSHTHPYFMHRLFKC